METSNLYAAILYLLTFRLAVIALGALSIYLGYRLFTQALPRRKGGDGGETALEAKFGDNELSLKNAAPGIFFAAFGALITIITLGKPEVKFNWEYPAKPAMEQPAAAQTDGKESTPPAQIAQNSGSAEFRGGPTVADAEHAHRHAWEHYDAALKWAQQAVEAAPASADYLDTLAALYFMDGKYKEAVETQDKAVQQAPGALAERLRAKLEIYRGALAKETGAAQ